MDTLVEVGTNNGVVSVIGSTVVGSPTGAESGFLAGGLPD
jgi:hypothetical protein